jgi:type IV pilus assembly protein PilV
MKKNESTYHCEKSFKGQRGFTVIEVLIAVSILTVGLLGVATMQMSAIRGNNFSDNTSTALALAEDRMETLLGMLDTNPLLVAGDQTDGLIDESGQAGGNYRRSWNVVNVVDPSTGISYKEIRMTVSWDNDSHSIMLSSIKR